MDKTTKTVLIILGVSAVAVGGYLIYDNFIKEPKGKGDVTPEAKNNKIIFTK